MINAKTIAVFIAGLAIGWLVTVGLRSPSFGGVYSQVQQYFPQGIFAGTTNQFSVTSAGLVTTGKTLTVTTSNTATSTLIAGCFQFYATSTATAQKFMASTTPGIMYSQYGTCP